MKKFFFILACIFCLNVFSVHSCVADTTTDNFYGFSGLFDSLSNWSEEVPEEQSSTDVEIEQDDAVVEVTLAGETLMVHESFKESMDQFEEFFDQYIEVMSADQVDMVTYVQMMTDYADIMEALEDIDEEMLTEDEDIYYLDVLNRINLKLMMEGD